MKRKHEKGGIKNKTKKASQGSLMCFKAQNSTMIERPQRQYKERISINIYNVVELSHTCMK